MAKIKVGQVYKLDGEVFVVSHLKRREPDVTEVHLIYDNGLVAVYPVDPEHGFDSLELLGEYPNWQAAVRSVLF